MLIVNGWVVHPDTCSLSRGDEHRKVSPRSMDVLCHLAKSPGVVISAQELLDKFWLKSSASDHAVHNVLASLRQAFKETESNPEVIRTYPKRGYALVARIEQATYSDTETAPSPDAANQNPKTNLGLGWLAKLKALPPKYHLPIMGIIVLGLTAGYAGSLRPTPALANSLLIEFQRPESNTDAFNYLERGFDSALVASLSKIPNLTLGFTGHNSLFDLNLPQLKASQAKYQLAVRKDKKGTDLTVGLSLTESATSELIMFEVLSITSDNFISQQEQLFQDLGSALRIHLDADLIKGMQAWGTDSAIAYDNFIKAEFYARQYNHSDWELAIAYYEKAISEDPLFVNAYLGLGSAINVMAVYSRQDKSSELKNKITEHSRQLEILLPESPAIQTLKSLALNIDGVSQKQLESKYRSLILAGDAPDYVFAQYGLFLIGARLYDEAKQFLDLAEASSSHTVSPNDSWNYKTLILPPWKIIPVKKAQLHDRPAHIGIIGKLIYSLALMGEFEEAEYFLEQQRNQDAAGIRTHLSQIIISASNGELRHETLTLNSPEKQGGDSSHAPHLLNHASVNDPNLQFNNGVMQFILGDLDKGISHWKDLKASDHRSLYTRIHALEPFFSRSVINDARYSALLEDLGAGASWQHTLVDGVEEMSRITGILPSVQAQKAKAEHRLMLTNNLWQEEDWQKIKSLRFKINRDNLDFSYREKKLSLDIK